MKEILLVTPSFEAGGTNSSLLSLLSSFGECDITIFPMSRCGSFKDKFASVPLVSEDTLLSLWFGNFAEFSVGHKLMALALKPIKKISARFGLNLEKKLLRRTAAKKKFGGYDMVIGYQEGSATEFASLIPAKEHVAWIHCNLHHSKLDYRRYTASYGACNKVVCVSESGKGAFDSIYPQFAGKSTVIYNVINASAIRKASEIPDRLVGQIPENYPVLLSVGRFDPIKQFERIPEIAARLKQHVSNFKWIIVGDGDPNVRKQIQDNITRFDVIDNVILAGFKANPYPLFRRANLYVCTSQSEACPMVFLEANVVGTPVVSNDFPSAHELIDNESAICKLDSMDTTIAKFLNKRSTIVVDVPQVLSRSMTSLEAILTD